MEQRLSDEAISHKLNESLLKEAEEIKAERKLLKVRLEKLEQSKGGISESVYKRVRDDYLRKCDETTERLIALRKDLEEEEIQITEKKNLIEAQLQLYKDSTEESQLRHSLGEFSTKEYQDLVQNYKEEIERLTEAEKDLAVGVERHRKIFADENLARSKKLTTPVSDSEPELTDSAPVLKGKSASVGDNTERVRIDLAKGSTDSVVVPPPDKAKPAKVEKKAAQLAEILVLANGNKNNVAQKVPVNKTIHIGRSPSNDIVLKEAKASRRHAEVQCVAGKYILLDLESSNGTFVSGSRVTEHTLQPEDEIEIGGAKLIFRLSASA